MINLKTFL